MNERRQADFFARKLLHSAVWANVRWKRDGYRTSPNQNRRWLVVGFRIRPISLGKSRRFYVHRTAPFRGFATRTKKKKKKKKKRTFVVSGGVRPNPPNPPCVRAWRAYQYVWDYTDELCYLMYSSFSSPFIRKKIVFQ